MNFLVGLAQEEGSKIKMAELNYRIIGEQELTDLVKKACLYEALSEYNVENMWDRYGSATNEYKKVFWEYHKDLFDPELLESTKDIDFSDIAHYRIQKYQRISLDIKFESSNKNE